MTQKDCLPRIVHNRNLLIICWLADILITERMIVMNQQTFDFRQILMHEITKLVFLISHL